MVRIVVRICGVLGGVDYYNPETVAVSYDIAKCFNAFERLEMLEEMVEEHDDGTTSCMQDMARYALMSYFEDGGACAWVWVSNEDHPEGGKWHRVVLR